MLRKQAAHVIDIATLTEHVVALGNYASGLMAMIKNLLIRSCKLEKILG